MPIHAKLNIIAIETSIALQIKHQLRTIKGDYFLQTEHNSLQARPNKQPVWIPQRKEASSSQKLLLCSSKMHRSWRMNLGHPGWHGAACKLPWKNLMMEGCFLFPSHTFRQRMQNFRTICRRLRIKCIWHWTVFFPAACHSDSWPGFWAASGLPEKE